ncbi:MAG: cupredoxin domain-containing protein [Nitrosarchaeum sp.]|nr:cupredoxin domain-containing protein [Nitrosarchaeum sp.]
MKRTSKIAIISCIVSVVIIVAALTVHLRLSETERSEIESGSEQNEKESASQVANEIVNSIQNKPESEQNENTEQTNTASNTTVDQIEISVKEVDEAYRWSNSTEINPTITLQVNMGNVIQFTNPTDTKHAFIIGQNDQVILESKDIGPGLSGKLSIKPTRTGVFEYHCKYHQDTMKGILNVEP